MVKVNRKHNRNRNIKYEMKTTLIGRHELNLVREALELLRNPEQSCVCLKLKKKSQIR